MKADTSGGGGEVSILVFLMIFGSFLSLGGEREGKKGGTGGVGECTEGCRIEVVYCGRLF